MKRLAAAWRRHPLLTTLFGLAVALTLFFAVRAIAFLIYWSDPAQRDQRIEGWMTPRYVALSWQAPPEVIRDALALGQDGVGARITLNRLARERGVPVASLITDLRAAIDASRTAPDD